MYFTANGGDINQLITFLEKDDTGVGNRIIAEHEVFQIYTIEVFKERTKSRKIETILQEFKGNKNNSSIKTENLKNWHDSYLKTFNECKNNYYGKIPDLVKVIKNEVGVAKRKSNGRWDEELILKIPSILGKICAVWTLMDIEKFKKFKNSYKYNNKDNDYARQPHAAQIVAIMRLLGVDLKDDPNKKYYLEKKFNQFTQVLKNTGNNIKEFSKDTINSLAKPFTKEPIFKEGNEKVDPEEYLCNNLAKIGTGNGKSVIMAITSTILALFGYEVNCACYSSYLSKRDYDAFLGIFEKFNVQNYIKYFTFNQLCEYIINQEINVREAIIYSIKESLNKPKLNNISMQSMINETKTDSRPKILFIDEVDVFFQDNFYGNIYNPCASLKDNTINDLAKFIWKNKKNINLSNLKNPKNILIVVKNFLIGKS